MKTFSSFLLLFILLYSCKPSLVEQEILVETMGTTGSIKFLNSKSTNFQHEIDSLLLDVNLSLSTYIDTSSLSLYNRGLTELPLQDLHFVKNYNMAIKVWNASNKAFNPGVLPLVNYWKVQNKQTESYALSIDSAYIDSLLQIVNADKAWKQIDFSAIAKGYGVDVVAHFLETKGIANYMVEIGGEVICKGKNKDNAIWKIGIEEPNEEKRAIYQVINLDNAAMATSGNYRNFKILDSGQKIVHTLNPKTGFPEVSNLLSASIIADNCMEADAYATACMVMGVDACYDMILKNKNLACYLLYSDTNGKTQVKMSPSFEKYLPKN